MKKIAILFLPILLTGCYHPVIDDEDIATKFYRKYQLSFNMDDPNKENEVDKFFERVVNKNGKIYGDKILLSFIQENCSYCQEQYKYIEEYLKEDKSLIFLSIFVDESDEDGNKYISDTRSKYPSFYSSSDEAFENSYYHKNYHRAMDDWHLTTPVNILLDFTNTAPSYTTELGFSERCYAFSQDLKISDMVNHIGLFGE